LQRFRWFRKRKRYNAAAWQSDLSVESLQSVLSGPDWKGNRDAHGIHLAGVIQDLFSKSGSVVSVLDVACFTGDYFGILMQLPNMQSMLSYTGVDITPSYLKSAEQRWQSYSNAAFRLASAYSLPFDDASFDVVFNTGLLIHLDDPVRAIREFARVAKTVVLVEATVDNQQTADWIDENKSGARFLDRVYRLGFIESALQDVGRIVAVKKYPQHIHQSALFQVDRRPQLEQKLDPPLR
jgi:ubiquinone/menaquinone biosynthesis C-methylase UbiE